MTQGEVLKKYGIVYMSDVDPDEEADDSFEEFVRGFAEAMDEMSKEGSDG